MLALIMLTINYFLPNNVYSYSIFFLMIKTVCINLTNFNTVMEAGAFFLAYSFVLFQKPLSWHQRLKSSTNLQEMSQRFGSASSVQWSTEQIVVHFPPPPNSFPTAIFKLLQKRPTGTLVSHVNFLSEYRNPSVRKFMMWTVTIMKVSSPVHFSEEYRTQRGSNVEICAVVINHYVYWPLF
jgi:hypothetical protein